MFGKKFLDRMHENDSCLVLCRLGRLLLSCPLSAGVLALGRQIVSPGLVLDRVETGLGPAVVPFEHHVDVALLLAGLLKHQRHLRQKLQKRANVIGQPNIS